MKLDNSGDCLKRYVDGTVALPCPYCGKGADILPIERDNLSGPLWQGACDDVDRCGAVGPLRLLAREAQREWNRISEIVLGVKKHARKSGRRGKNGRNKRT